MTSECFVLSEINYSKELFIKSKNRYLNAFRLKHVINLCSYLGSEQNYCPESSE